jgi:hypothetical protein
MSIMIALWTDRETEVHVPTWLVSVPVGIGHFIPAEPVEFPRAVLVKQGYPE